jgi:hypothetical protein
MIHCQIMQRHVVLGIQNDFVGLEAAGSRVDSYGNIKVGGGIHLDGSLVGVGGQFV